MARDYQSGYDKQKEFEEKVIKVDRITKVVSGGKRMAFRALVAVGDRNGRVGIGSGKSREVAAAVRKGVEHARKQMIFIPRVGKTIPHEVTGRLGASTVMLKPAPSGHGVIAGGAARHVCELGGIGDIVAKSFGSYNAINISKATINALKQLKTKAQEKKHRGVADINVRFRQEGEESVQA